MSGNLEALQCTAHGKFPPSGGRANNSSIQEHFSFFLFFFGGWGLLSFPILLDVELCLRVKTAAALITGNIHHIFVFHWKKIKLIEKLVWSIITVLISISHAVLTSTLCSPNVTAVMPQGLCVPVVTVDS